MRIIWVDYEMKFTLPKQFLIFLLPLMTSCMMDLGIDLGSEIKIKKKVEAQEEITLVSLTKSSDIQKFTLQNTTVKTHEHSLSLSVANSTFEEGVECGRLIGTLPAKA